MIQNTKPIIEWTLNEIKQECENTALCRDCRMVDVCNLYRYYLSEQNALTQFTYPSELKTHIYTIGSDEQPRLWEFPEYNFDKYNDLLEE